VTEFSEALVFAGGEDNVVHNVDADDLACFTEALSKVDIFE
jgi:alpha-beta hydrolase superfamily lysophospholipase